MVVVAKLEMEEGRLVHFGEDARWTGGRGRDLPPSWQWGPGPPRLADPAALPLAHQDWPREMHLIQTGSVSPLEVCSAGPGDQGLPPSLGAQGTWDSVGWSCLCSLSLDSRRRLPTRETQGHGQSEGKPRVWCPEDST